MLRGALSVVSGAVAWYVSFYAMVMPLILIWPAYAASVQVYADTDVFDFTATMYWIMVVFWLLAGIAGGWVAVLVARRRDAVAVLAALLTAMMAFMHLYYVWDRLPWWYNVLVVLPVAPAVWLGGKLAFKRFARRATAPSAAASA